MPSSLAGEQLITLRQLANNKQAIIRRNYTTLFGFCKTGAENLSGDPVLLEHEEVRGILHTSLEALQRFVTAMNSQTLNCHCLGGCLDGRRAKVSDHIKRVTSGELIRSGAITPKLNGGAPADHLYYKQPWIDSGGAVVPFLIWSQLEDAEKLVRKIVEGR